MNRAILLHSDDQLNHPFFAFNGLRCHICTAHRNITNPKPNWRRGDCHGKFSKLHAGTFICRIYPCHFDSANGGKLRHCVCVCVAIDAHNRARSNVAHHGVRYQESRLGRVIDKRKGVRCARVFVIVYLCAFSTCF